MRINMMQSMDIFHLSAVRRVFTVRVPLKMQERKGSHRSYVIKNFYFGFVCTQNALCCCDYDKFA